MNRERKLQIRYTINGRKQQGLAWTMQDGFDPDTADGAVPVEVKVDGLLAHPIIGMGSEQATVADVIRYGAYVAGAVHAGVASGPIEESLDDFAKFMKIGGIAPHAGALRAVGRVVYKGLAPLADLIRAESGLPPDDLVLPNVARWQAEASESRSQE